MNNKIAACIIWGGRNYLGQRIRHYYNGPIVQGDVSMACIIGIAVFISITIVVCVASNINAKKRIIENEKQAVIQRIENEKQRVENEKQAVIQRIEDEKMKKINKIEYDKKERQSRIDYNKRAEDIRQAKVIIEIREAMQEYKKEQKRKEDEFTFFD